MADILISNLWRPCIVLLYHNIFFIFRITQVSKLTTLKLIFNIAHGENSSTYSKYKSLTVISLVC